jgi:tyrosyl-tRNA synthetase
VSHLHDIVEWELELTCRFHALTTTRAAEHAGADVVKASESPLMCSLMYPGLQALDEQYLDVDFQFGGVDQVSTFRPLHLYEY